MSKFTLCVFIRVKCILCSNKTCVIGMRVTGDSTMMGWILDRWSEKQTQNLPIPTPGGWTSVGAGCPACCRCCCRRDCRSGACGQIKVTELATYVMGVLNGVQLTVVNMWFSTVVKSLIRYVILKHLQEILVYWYSKVQGTHLVLWITKRQFTLFRKDSINLTGTWTNIIIASLSKR